MNYTYIVIDLHSNERTEFTSISKAQQYIDNCKQRHPACIYRIEVK